jgi:hypothetical protein
MSEAQEKIKDTIEELATAVTTAYVKYINEHREVDSASVLTASALYVAIITDSLSFDEGDPSQEEVLGMIVDAARVMLKDLPLIRSYIGAILYTVMAEMRQPQ